MISRVHTEDEAVAALERIRWPNGATCPHCGGANPWRLTPRNPTPGKRTIRKGLWKCSACRKQFTVKVGTIFESSHIPVAILLATARLLKSQDGKISALQLQRVLGITYRAARRLHDAITRSEMLSVPARAGASEE